MVIQLQHFLNLFINNILGLQRFRLDYDGLRNLSFDSPTEFNFKIKRYAEMLWDTYIVVNMLDIWSPLYDISGKSV